MRTYNIYFINDQVGELFMEKGFDLTVGNESLLMLVDIGIDETMSERKWHSSK